MVETAAAADPWMAAIHLAAFFSEASSTSFHIISTGVRPSHQPKLEIKELYLVERVLPFNKDKTTQTTQLFLAMLITSVLDSISWSHAKDDGKVASGSHEGEQAR